MPHRAHHARCRNWIGCCAESAAELDQKVDGTENVYIFRYGGHQSMFVVTPQGVIATDPISYLRPAKPYIDAIKSVTDKPIKYVIYSHHHYDHIAGGQPFKDLGATFIAHRRTKERLL